MSNVKKQVLTDIKERGITPTSRFYFVTKNYFFGLLFVVSVLVGAISFSSILHDLVLGSAFYLGTPLFVAPTVFVQSIPLFWLALLVIFTLSAWFNFKRTDGAHRKENAIIVLASILFSLLLGLLMFQVGMSGQLDRVLKAYVPLYRASVEDRLERNAEYLKKKELDEKAIMIMLERERLRTLCLNHGRDDCFDDFEKKEEVKEKE